MDNVKMSSPIFLCDLDRYGRIGHQTSRMLTAFLLAHLTDGYFIPLEYKFFPYRANQIFDFSKSERSINQDIYISSYFNLTKGFREPHGNDCYDLSSFDELKTVLESVNSKLLTNTDGYTFIQLAFDQPPGLLLKLLRDPKVINDFQRVFIGYSLINSSPKIPKFDLVIHIRRGDVSKTSYPDWWIDDEIYINLLDILSHKSDNSTSICICTQSGVSEKLVNYVQFLQKKYYRKFTLRAAKEAWSNVDEIQDFLLMANARILIGGQSSFPCLAALATQNNYIFLGNEKPKEYPFALQPCSSFFLTEYKTTKSAATSIANQIITKLNTNI